MTNHVRRQSLDFARQQAGHADDDVLPGSPLPAGVKLAVLAQQGLWWCVDVLNTVSGVMDLVGWRHSRFLAQTG